MPRTVNVELGERSYGILIGTGLIGEAGQRCRELRLGAACLLVSDANVDDAYGSSCAESLAQAGYRVGRFVVPAGEPSKSEAHLFRLYDAALERGLDRKSFIVALGGGVVGDLAGYGAASFLRGIDLVQIPTSVVAMVDSAVGGKTGVNLAQGKNLVGAFHQPRLVLVDLDTLRTLPRREYVSGLAEIVKYGVIRDAALFASLEEDAEKLVAGDGDLLEEVIARSCEIKADVVGQDERESGLRAILNFGHTLAHALENVAGYGAFLHGEAVAVGMAFAGRLSVAQAGFPDPDRQRLESLLGKLGLPMHARGCRWEDLRRAMSVDKKSVGRAPRFVLARALGEVAVGCEVPERLLEETWNVFGQ